MSVPEEIRNRLKVHLWKVADQIGWMNLPPTQKSQRYEDWSRSQDVGGLLSRFMDRGKVRLYIKDTILKGYAGERCADPERPMRVAGIKADVEVLEEYVKPHGRRFNDGRIISWGRAEDWKAILMALHERAFLCRGVGALPFAAVLMHADGRFGDPANRLMIQAAGTKLGIEKIVWLDA